MARTATRAAAATSPSSSSKTAQHDEAEGRKKGGKKGGRGSGSGVESRKNSSSKLSLSKRKALEAAATSTVGSDTPKYSVGTEISKPFDGVAYRGEVISYDPRAKYYKVRYVEDGDEEELEEAEVERYRLDVDSSGGANAKGEGKKTAAAKSPTTNEDQTAEAAAAAAAAVAAKPSKSKGMKTTAKKKKKDIDGAVAKKPKSGSIGGSSSKKEEGRKKRKPCDESGDLSTLQASGAAAQSSKKRRKSSDDNNSAKVDAQAAKKGNKSIQSNNEPLYPIGTATSKEFDGIAYRGEVISYDKATKYYRVRYEDGDEEELDLKEMKRYAVVGTGDEKKETGAAGANEQLQNRGDIADGSSPNAARKSDCISKSIKANVNTKATTKAKAASRSDRDESKKATKKRTDDEQEKAAKDKSVSKKSDERDITLPAKAQMAEKNDNKKNSTAGNSSRVDDDAEEESETYYPGHVCRDLQFYTTLNNETPKICAEKLGSDCKDVVSTNRERYKGLTASSKLKEGTILRIPDKYNVEMVLALYRYEEGEDKLDFCCECYAVEDPNGPPMLLCDRCDAACHLTCTHDMLTDVPDSDWYCKKCCSKETPKELVASLTVAKPKASGTLVAKQGKKKAGSKLKLAPKAKSSRAKIPPVAKETSAAKPSGSGARKASSATSSKRKRQPSSSTTPKISHTARSVTPATDVMDSLAFIGGGVAATTAASSSSKAQVSKSRSSKMKKQSKKSPPRSKRSNNQESVLSSPAHLPSKKLLAVLDGQAPEADEAEEKQVEQPKESKKQKRSKKHSREDQAERTKSDDSPPTAATMNTSIDDIAQSVEEEFRKFEQARLKGEKQTISLRIRRLRQEISALQEADSEDTEGKSEAALVRAKKIKWKQLECENLVEEEKRIGLRLEELSGASLPKPTVNLAEKPAETNEKKQKKKRGRPRKEGTTAKAKNAETRETDGDGDALAKKKAKQGRQKATKSSVNASNAAQTEQPVVKRKRGRPSKKNSMGQGCKPTVLSEPARKRKKALQKRKQLSERSRRGSKSSGDDGDSDEDYEQIWVNSNDSDDDLFVGDDAEDEARPKKKRRGRPPGSKSSSGKYYRWLPCGNCIGCLQTKDCGRCRSCLERPPEDFSGATGEGFRRFICIHRQCLKPIIDSGESSDSTSQKLPARPVFPGGIKPPKEMPRLGGVKKDPPSTIQADNAAPSGSPLVHPNEEAAEIESLSDGGAGIFEMSDMEDEESDAAGLNLSTAAPKLAGVHGKVTPADEIAQAKHDDNVDAMPPLPPVVDVPSSEASKLHTSASAGVVNAAQMARDLIRRDRSYNGEGDDLSSVESQSLGSDNEDGLVALPPL